MEEEVVTMEYTEPPEDIVQSVLETIGTFRKDAPIQTDDVRFASKCDGMDLSEISAKQLTSILRKRCTPHKRKGRYSTLWTRKW